MLENEFATFFNSRARQFYQLAAEGSIGRRQSLVGALGFFETLLALYILMEDFAPWRSDENDRVIAKFPGGLLHIVRRGDIHQAQVSEHVGNAAVEEHRSMGELCYAIRAHLPGEHEFGKEERVAPRQRVSVDRDLVLNNSAARFERTSKAANAKGFDEGGLARARTSGN